MGRSIWNVPKCLSDNIVQTETQCLLKLTYERFTCNFYFLGFPANLTENISRCYFHVFDYLDSSSHNMIILLMWF